MSRLLKALSVFWGGIVLVSTALSPLCAADVVVLISKENRVYRRIASSFRGAVGLDCAIVTLPAGGGAGRVVKDNEPGLLVVVGNEAAAWALDSWSDTPIVIAGIIPSLMDSAESLTVPGVSLDIPVEQQVKAMKKFLPSVKTVGTVFRPRLGGDAVRRLKAAAGPRGIHVWAEPAPRNRDFVPAVKRMGTRIDAFLVLFDPVLLRPEAFQYLIRFSLTHQVPLVVPAFALLESGGMLSLEADYEGIGRQTAAVALRVRDGSSEATDLESPEGVKIGFNIKMARLMGIPFPSSEGSRVDRFYE